MKLEFSLITKEKRSTQQGLRDDHFKEGDDDCDDGGSECFRRRQRSWRRVVSEKARGSTRSERVESKGPKEEAHLWPIFGDPPCQTTQRHEANPLGPRTARAFDLYGQVGHCRLLARISPQWAECWAQHLSRPRNILACSLRGTNPTRWEGPDPTFPPRKK
ncbi:hypothetical protein PIB30_018199 [Stylosanthes scabra]|uniref:Uncharacterized protein n=1 Tax=Stylosanthes scabra TaxID=79078 RepID=A0ABU6T7L5_9FABA|nr:hypothetical protein [Stylosanthes scabra]